MKHTDKGPEPISLQAYRLAKPAATWDDLRNDALFGGEQAYKDIRTQTHADQGGVCAYCEIDVGNNDPLKSRIEHFHPKADTSTPMNWALDWPNMLAVCLGGSYRHGSAPHTLEPLASNLSCDAHKDLLIQQGQLSSACEGWVINPLLLPGSPCLFRVDKFKGELLPHEGHCAAAAPWPGNMHADLQTLVAHTIKVLNLNCPRLCAARLAVVHDIERNKKKIAALKLKPEEGMARLAQRYLQHRWPAFVTTIRSCLGAAAEARMAAL